MRDEIYDREFQQARSNLVEDVALLAQALGSAFRTLTRIRFEAPWTNYRGHSL